MSRPGSIERLNQRMAAIPEEVRKALIPAVDKSAQELVREIKRNAPKDDGDLQGSVRDKPGRIETGRRVVAGGQTTTRPSKAGPYDYAMAQELGTKQMPANPFFYPAKRKLQKRITSRLQREARKAIRAFWGKP